MQRLTVTHVTRWQKHRQLVGGSPVYQGRFKSFPVETDDCFDQVVRYVECNALRAGLCRQAEDWRWGSLWRRVFGTAEQRRLLGDWPLPRPRLWIDHVNRPQTDAELHAIHRCVTRGQPLGTARWIEQTARQLGLDSTLRSRGRPPKPADDRIPQSMDLSPGMFESTTLTSIAERNESRPEWHCRLRGKDLRRGPTRLRQRGDAGSGGRGEQRW